MLEKHAFIRYLVSQHAFKRRQVIWVLNFLAHNEHYLDDLRFVEDVTGCPRRLIISTHEMTTPSLLFCDKDGETSVAETIIERMKTGYGEPIYVQVNFPNWQGNLRYLKILEDNPFVDGLPYQQEISQYAEEVIQQALKEMEKSKLTEQIDKALDEKNQPLFEELTKKLLEL